jgi:nucleoside-diphosphate-sugar epimerase
VAALARRPDRAGVLRALGCRVVEGTIEDEAAALVLAEGADVVFHVAGLVAARSEAEFLRVNRDGAVALARASARAGVSRFVLVSSLSVTGPSPPGHPVDEASGPGPVTAYGRSKKAGEEAVRAAGVPFVVVRPPAAYGPRDRAFLALFRTASRGVVPLLGDGGQELTLVHAADLARALVAVATSAATLGGTYHAGHPEPVTQRALAGAVGRAVGRRVRGVALSGRRWASPAPPRGPWAGRPSSTATRRTSSWRPAGPARARRSGATRAGRRRYRSTRASRKPRGPIGRPDGSRPAVAGAGLAVAVLIAGRRAGYDLAGPDRTIPTHGDAR